jgi:hypothetical protein
MLLVTTDVIASETYGLTPDTYVGAPPGHVV